MISKPGRIKGEPIVKAVFPKGEGAAIREFLTAEFQAEALLLWFGQLQIALVNGELIIMLGPEGVSVPLAFQLDFQVIGGVPLEVRFETVGELTDTPAGSVAEIGQ